MGKTFIPYLSDGEVIAKIPLEQDEEALDRENLQFIYFDKYHQARETSVVDLRWKDPNNSMKGYILVGQFLERQNIPKEIIELCDPIIERRQELQGVSKIERSYLTNKFFMENGMIYPLGEIKDLNIKNMKILYISEKKEIVVVNPTNFEFSDPQSRNYNLSLKSDCPRPRRWIDYISRSSLEKSKEPWAIKALSILTDGARENEQK